MTRRIPSAERMALTVEEAAEQLAISRSQAYALVKRGVIPSILVGKARRVPRRALEAWVEDQAKSA